MRPIAAVRRTVHRLAFGVVAVLLMLVATSCTTPLGGNSLPSLTIERPIDGGTVVTGVVDVTGRFTADGGVSIVARNATTGSAYMCSSASDGFTCSGVALDIGANSVFVTVTDGQGRTARDAVSVTRESSEAALRIVTPASAGVTASSTIDVAGSVSGFGNDLVVSIETGAVSGICTDASGGFSCTDVPLLEGDNLLIVTGIDSAGREASDAVFVEYRPDFTDSGAPSVAITTPGDGETVNASWVRVFATVVDDGVIEVIEAIVDGVSVMCEYDDATDTAECLVFLVEPTQTIEVRARDAAGNIASDSVAIMRNLETESFDIDLAYFPVSPPPFSATQQAAFDDAVAFWEGVIVGDLEPVTVDFPEGTEENFETAACVFGEPAFEGTIDDLRVYVTSFSDNSNTLALAAPCMSRGGGEDEDTTFVGLMAFNATYLDSLEADGQLVATIVHELGHVLGIGTYWDFGPFRLLQYEPTEPDCRNAEAFDIAPTYVGEFGRLAFERLGGVGSVPVEDEGGPGTQCGHWDEETFGNELMTGTINVGDNPLSEMTIASLIDLGLTVDLAEAEDYQPPTDLSPQSAVGFDLGAREVLLPPRGTVDPDTGRIELFEPHTDQRMALPDALRPSGHDQR